MRASTPFVLLGVAAVMTTTAAFGLGRQTTMHPPTAADDDDAAAEVDLLKFTEADRYERWQHFKDYGVPGTLEDPLNRAAIADGTCRLLSGTEYTGFHFWNHPDRVATVLTALAAAPATDSPSRFTLQATAALTTACATTDLPEEDSRASDSPDQAGAIDDASTFEVAARAAALDNWYRALCVPASSASWGDASAYDP